jgi:hypothetical protein
MCCGGAVRIGFANEPFNLADRHHEIGDAAKPHFYIMVERNHRDRSSSLICAIFRPLRYPARMMMRNVIGSQTRYGDSAQIIVTDALRHSFRRHIAGV